jgi:hypothetical protein
LSATAIPHCTPACENETRFGGNKLAFRGAIAMPLYPKSGHSSRVACLLWGHYRLDL